ncbi:MAG TPA: hypothetical protein ENG83_01515 [Nitrospirae bacterium]|nr:hypothetical protein [Nitrospirota bacterium]HDL20866.1 hypothetical protein [Nitrospirota bacterium]HDZ03238.1 hypothetical protein [Nitrospirota bacterium]
MEKSLTGGKEQPVKTGSISEIAASLQKGKTNFPWLPDAGVVLPAVSRECMIKKRGKGTE